MANLDQPIKLFIGCDPNNSDLEQMMVLDYSLHKHTSEPVEIIWMQLSRDPSSVWYSNPQTGEGWHTEKWATPFSGFRWAIPAYCGFSGRAIYMDAYGIAKKPRIILSLSPIYKPSLRAIAK